MFLCELLEHFELRVVRCEFRSASCELQAVI